LEGRTSLKNWSKHGCQFFFQHKHENTFSLGEARLCKKRKNREKITTTKEENNVNL